MAKLVNAAVCKTAMRRFDPGLRLQGIMNRRLSWDLDLLPMVVKSSVSIREVIKKLGLIPAGGNYRHIKQIIAELDIDTSHFLGQGSNSGIRYRSKKPRPIEELLVAHSNIQSFKLKKRLFLVGLKDNKCEECGWAKMTDDGRIPLELDHVNGNKYDNRIENLRVLCPNCHSLKPTHRGKNKAKKARVVEW